MFRNIERNKEIVWRYGVGTSETMAQIGTRFGITRSRVAQIIDRELKERRRAERESVGEKW